jgi:hypothetical protein
MKVWSNWPMLIEHQHVRTSVALETAALMLLAHIANAARSTGRWSNTDAVASFACGSAQTIGLSLTNRRRFTHKAARAKIILDKNC